MIELPSPNVTMSECSSRTQAISEEIALLKATFEDSIRFHYEQLRHELVELEDQRRQEERERVAERNRKVGVFLKYFSAITGGFLGNTLLFLSNII